MSKSPSGNILVYAPEDRHNKKVEKLLSHIQDVQVVQIDAALALLTATALRRVFLLMSIDFLHWLLCAPSYDALYRLLCLYEREGLLVIVTLRACAWENTFRHSLGIPPEGLAMRGMLEW